MKVILQKDIPNLGEAGDIKEVADGYARNFLLPKKMVMFASEASKKAVEHQKKIIKLKKAKRKAMSEKLMDEIAKLQVTITARVGEEDKLFGSVTAIDIAKALKDMGQDIDKRKIQLDEPIKKIGEYQVPIKLHEGLTATLKVCVTKVE